MTRKARITPYSVLAAVVVAIPMSSIALVTADTDLLARGIVAFRSTR